MCILRYRLKCILRSHRIQAVFISTVKYHSNSNENDSNSNNTMNLNISLHCEVKNTKHNHIDDNNNDDYSSNTTKV